MNIWKAVSAAAIVWLGAGAAAAQEPLAVGTNPQGSLFHAVAKAIAQVALAKGKVSLVPVPSDEPAAYLPSINGGGMAFGLANSPEAAFAYAGTGLYEGRPHPNLRMVFALFPTAGGFAVPSVSAIRTVAELRGKRVPTGYQAGRMFHYVSNALLAAGNLTENAIVGVETANYVTAIKALVSGGVDAAYIPFNSRLGVQAMKSIPGGWRYLNFDPSPATVGRMWGSLPTAGSVQVKPDKDATGVADDPTTLLRIDFVMVASASVQPDTVYHLLRAIHRNQTALANLLPAFHRFSPRDMAPRHPVPYHPGALKYYREVGILTE